MKIYTYMLECFYIFQPYWVINYCTVRLSIVLSREVVVIIILFRPIFCAEASLCVCVCVCARARAYVSLSLSLLRQLYLRVS
jgi:hypothetical protein